MWYAITFIIAAVIVFECITIAQSKKAHYRVWKQEFERELGAKLDDENIIHELYDETMSPKTAAEHYKEVKGLCEEAKNN